MPLRHIGICAHYKEENVVASPTTWLCPMLFLLLLLAVALKWFILISRVNWLKNARLTEQQGKQREGKRKQAKAQVDSQKELARISFSLLEYPFQCLQYTILNYSSTPHC